MRHKVESKRLGRKTAHRDAMLAAVVCGLIQRKRVRTTVTKAKMASRLADRMVTLAKRGTLACRRRAIATLRQELCVARLFAEDSVAAFRDRQGGYTRVLKLGRRKSDGSEMAILEWTSTPAATPSPEAQAKAKA